MPEKPILSIVTIVSSANSKGLKYGICPRCGTREKAVTRTGNRLPYCRICWNEYFRLKMRQRSLDGKKHSIK